VHQAGGIHMQEYVIGKPKAKVKQVGKSPLHGTIIKFKPDETIFKDGIEWNWEKNSFPSAPTGLLGKGRAYYRH